MDVLGAVLFLRNLNLDPETRSLELGLGEMKFIIDGRWEILPPAVPALHCYCAVLLDAEIHADLQVLTENEAREKMRNAAQMHPTIRWRIDQ